MHDDQYHAFTQEHLLNDCPLTAEWRDCLTHYGQDTLANIIPKLKHIWKTPGATWKEQLKYKRVILQPIGELAKQWHATGTDDVREP